MSTLIFFKLVLIYSCFVTVCLSYNFADENPIKLVADYLRDEINNDDPFFPSLPVKAIYQFGDSISDTGNLIRADPTINCAQWPYGQSSSNKPTGRCSDGLLIIDFFAQFLNMPLIDPYLNKEGNFTHGVNFAVASATAMNVSILEEKYDIFSLTNLSLSVQLEWFESHLLSFYPHPQERRSKLAKAIIIMGEIGGNDYNHAFIQGATLSDAYKMVPDVIEAIINAAKKIIYLGAKQIVIPGNFPIGCAPMYLTLYKTNDSNKYDEIKCLKEYNKHAEFHNEQLQETIIELQKGHPNVTIVYMDYFGPVVQILQHPTLYGFDESTIQEACCGDEDSEYKVNMNVYCGFDGSVCENPGEHFSWDGTHLTQHAYHVLAKLLMPSLLRVLQNVV